MAVKIWRQGLVILMIAALFYSPRPLFSCVEFAQGPLFTYTKHPDLPLDKFVRGNLGVLQPTYARSYLCVAYRTLSGARLNRAEQKAVLDLWNQRLTGRWEPGDLSGRSAWQAVRAKVPGVEPMPVVRPYRNVQIRHETYDSYGAYLNCGEDAFAAAAKTLEERIKRFGAASPEVRDWVRAQDHVFANCAAGRTIPEPATAASHPLIQDDRAYQIAASYFHAEDYDTAAKLFGEIAKDPSSPRRPLAAYLVARAYVRKAFMMSGVFETDKVSLGIAETQLKKVLADRSMREIHPAARRMLGIVLFRLRPEQRLHELAQGVLRRNSGKTLKQDLWDYTLLLDRMIGEQEYEFGTDRNAIVSRKYQALSSVRRRDDLTDWVLTFQTKKKAALDHAVEKWGVTASLPWLVVSLSKISADHPRLPELLDAAEKVEPNSPGFASVAFHHLLLLMESGQREPAIEKLDALLARGKPAFSSSSLNLFLALRMRLARDLGEFLQYAQRASLGILFDIDGRELPEDPASLWRYESVAKRRIFFDIDAAKTLNEKVPLRVLKEAAASGVLPRYLRQEMARAAWVRSVLLDNEEIGLELVPMVNDLVPELKPYLNAYLSADNSEARKFAGLYAILKFPGLRPYVDAGVGRLTRLSRIDDLRDNWWCSADPRVEQEYRNYFRREPLISEPLSPLYPDGQAASPEFLDEAQKAMAEGEWKQLFALPTAPNYLCQQAIEWARRVPRDPRVPEALHLAVRSTRYGCTDEQTGKYSKAAFDLLHKRYPKSEWAKKTPYWFQ